MNSGLCLSCAMLSVRGATAVWSAGLLQRRLLATHTPVRGLEAAAESSRTRRSLVSDDVVDKLVNLLMYDGKKETANRVVQDVSGNTH